MVAAATGVARTRLYQWPTVFRGDEAPAGDTTAAVPRRPGRGAAADGVAPAALHLGVHQRHVTPNRAVERSVDRSTPNSSDQSEAKS